MSHVRAARPVRDGLLDVLENATLEVSQIS